MSQAGLRQPSGSARSSGNYASSPPSSSISSSPQWTKTPANFQNGEDSSYIMEIEDLRQENQQLQSNVEQLETIIASMEEDSMTQQQAMLNQQNLQKQLEEKMSDLEQRLLDAATDTGGPGEELEELKSSNESLHAAQAEQDELIKDLESRLNYLQEQLNSTSTADLKSSLETKDGEINRYKEKVAQLHQQATDKVNRANIMLQERDARIHELKAQLDGETDHSHLLETIQILEQQVQTMEVELITHREQQGSSAGPETPVIAKSEAKKAQRSAAPPPPMAEDLVRKLEAEVQQAKTDLNDQQALFEQLLAKQAEEMSAEFENSLRKQAEDVMLSQGVQHKAHLQEHIAQLENEVRDKTNSCKGFKRLIEQQDEVVLEQKKVLEAQSSSARFAVENLQKILKETQQKLKDDVVRIQSKDAEIAALRDGVKQKAGVEQRANALQKEQERLGADILDLRSNLDVKCKEAESLKMQLQRLASDKDRELRDLKHASQKDLKNLHDEFHRQHDEIKMKNKNLIHDSEVHMKKSWEQQDQIQRVSRELEDRTHALDIKDKTVGKLSVELQQMQQTLNSTQTKMGRMETVLMTQENMLQESHDLADKLRVKVSGLERTAQDTIHETELGAYEELAMVKSRMQVLEGEYEAMKNMVASNSCNDGDSPVKIQKRGIKAQRSAPPPPPPGGGNVDALPYSAQTSAAAMIASSDVYLARLEKDLQHAKERADVAEHASTQLKVDIIMFEEKYEDDCQDQLAVRKQELIAKMMATEEACRSAENRSKRLEVELTEERRKGSEAPSNMERDDKSALQGKIEMRMSKTDQDASTGDGDRKDPKILLLQLEEANGKVSDMQMRLDTLFEKNMAVEKRAREAELERKRAAEEQDSYKDKSNSLQREQNEAQQQIVELESVINKLQRSQCTSEREISGYQTDLKTQKKDVANLKEKNANLTEIVEKEKQAILSLQSDLDSSRDAMASTDTELRDVFSKVARLEDLLREVTMQRDALREEKSKRDVQLRQTKDEANSVRRSHDELQQQVMLLKAEVVKVQQNANLYDFESKKSGEQIAMLKKSDTAHVKEIQNLMQDAKKSLTIVTEKEQDIRVLKNEIAAAKNARDGLTSDLRKTATLIKMLEEERKGLGTEVEDLQASMDLLQTEKTAVEDRAANADSQNSKATIYTAAIENEKKEASMNVGRLTGELEHTNTRLEVMAAEKEALAQQLQMLQFKFEDADRDLSGEQSEKSLLETKVRAMETEREVVMASNRALESKILQFEEKEKKLNKALDDLNDEGRRLDESLEQSRSSLQAAQHDNADLSKKCEAFKLRMHDDNIKQAVTLGKVQLQIQAETDKTKKVKADSVEAQQVAYRREQEFQTLMATVAELKTDLANAQTQITIMDNDYKVLEGTLAKAQHADKSSSAELQKMMLVGDSLKTTMAQVSKVTAEKNSMQAQVNELQDLLEAKKAEFKLHDERLVSAEMEIQSLTKEKLSRSVQSAQMLADVHGAKSESNSLTMRLHASNQRVNELKLRADTAADAQVELQHEVDQSKQENTSLATKLAALQSEMAGVSSGSTDVSSENAALAHQLQIYKIENENLYKGAQASEMLVQKLKRAWQDEKETLESETRNLQAERVSLISRLETVQAAEHQLRQQSKKLASELDSLTADNEKLEAKATSFKSKFDKAEAGRLSPTPSVAQAGAGDSDLDKAEERIVDLLSQRELMVEELSSRKMLLESAMREAEVTMSGAESAVAKKSAENRKLSGENHRLQMELSMHRAEKEALNEDRQKLQRQMMALTADKETLQDQLKQVSS